MRKLQANHGDPPSRYDNVADSSKSKAVHRYVGFTGTAPLVVINLKQSFGQRFYSRSKKTDASLVDLRFEVFICWGHLLLELILHFKSSNKLFHAPRGFLSPSS